MAKKKAKRYSEAEKKEILDFIAKQGRGGQTKAVEKYGVTAATIASWKKKAAGGAAPAAPPRKSTKVTGSTELEAVEELGRILKDIAATEQQLDSLKKQYEKAKAKI